MKITNRFAVVLCICLPVALMHAARAAVTIVSQGRSTFTIVIPVKAPESVRAAAVELQRDIALSTGAKLPIKKDSEKIIGSFISLGSTSQAKSAGITAQGVDVEGFHIVTKDGNLYILGPDTADGEYTANGGTSNGTANGVYTFLEDYLGVRWLMPGELGLDVPQKSTFEVEEMNRTEAPLFVYRNLTYVQKTASVEQWKTHQKLGYSFHLNVGHNWYPTVPASLYKTHPEWFAMINGKRVDPAPLGNRYKLETTNPELVKYYAEKAVAAFQADPHLNTFSLSPNDSRGWSESPESKALYDPPPAGSDFPSITPLILKWYRDVSAIVAKEYPQGKLAGYIYTDFSRPPLQGSMKLPENFVPVITGQGFGYRFYRPEVRELAKNLIQEWAKVAPSTWFYYGMPIWLRSSTGMLTTAAPDNLNFVFSLLRDNHIKGAEIYGNFSWSQAAMGNYIEAKMLWNPALDAHDLQREWLTRAYGTEAGAAMGELYDKMDNGAFADYFRQDPSQHYNVREQMFKEYYAPHYAEIEEYFLRARSKNMTDVQKKRLQLIENNLIVLQWRLRNAGYLRDDFKSPLRRTNAEVASILLERNSKTQTDDFPGLNTRPQREPVEKIEIANLPSTENQTKGIPNSDRVLLYPTKDMTIRLKAANVHPGSSFLIYVISKNKHTNESLYGYQEQTGVLYSREEIAFEAKANTLYYFKAEPHEIIGATATWDMFVAGATPAKVGFQNGTLYLDGPPASLYVHAPLNMETRKDASGVMLLSKAATAVLQRLYPDAKPVMNLDDAWRFKTDPEKMGLKQNYNDSSYDDSAWKVVDATDYWQNQGVDYHGTAWYRKTFTTPPIDVDDPLGVDKRQFLLYFGAVDGDAVVYINGKKIGEHLPSKLGEGWDQPFVLDVTHALKSGQNTIAVQVTKEKYKSGIYKGVTLMLAEKAAG